MHIYGKGVYLTLCVLALQNFANSEYPVENKATVDAYVWYVFIIVVYFALWDDTSMCFISAWVSALLVRTG